MNRRGFNVRPFVLAVVGLGVLSLGLEASSTVQRCLSAPEAGRDCHRAGSNMALLDIFVVALAVALPIALDHLLSRRERNG